MPSLFSSYKGRSVLWKSFTNIIKRLKSSTAIIAVFFVSILGTSSCLTDSSEYRHAGFIYINPTCVRILASEQESSLDLHSGSCIPYKYLGSDTYLGITCRHVLQDIHSKNSNIRKYISVIIPTVNKGRIAEDTFEKVLGEIHYMSDKYDLAIVKFKTTERIVTARLSNSNNIKSYTPVHQLGYPSDMFLTRTIGETQYIHHSGNWVATCSTLPGVSGGGMFDSVTNELIGISYAVFVHRGFQSHDRFYTTYAVLFIPIYNLRQELP